ncbi:TPA: hypothetical protein MM834_003348 [Salmonella enterica subsp. houtenae]|nr:hypothetical protein [Salmonella enterica subsp. houtenae serovar 40:z4,z24:-]HBZ8550735.1 hypothetical protein [Salmonella enterica subsp. houtenae]
MTINRFDLPADLGAPEYNRLMRFTDGVLTLQHQIKRADDFAQDGQWLMAPEYLDVSTRTLNILKRVAREVSPTVNEEKQP